MLFGPPGIGKSHLAIAFGMTAIEKGYTVCFERVTNLIKLLKVSEIQRTAEFRIKKILKSNLLIIDEIGYTPIDRKEANIFFNLISELYEKTSIIITSNKGFDKWAEMMGDDIMTTAMLDRLLHHAKLFNLDGDSYRLKNKTLAKLTTRFPFFAERFIKTFTPLETEGIPWTPLTKPLAESKIALITTAGVHYRDQSPFNMRDPNGDPSFRVIDSSRLISELMITHDYYDHSDADKDINIVFPIQRLVEFASEGVIGEVAKKHYGLMGHILKKV